MNLDPEMKYKKFMFRAIYSLTINISRDAWCNGYYLRIWTWQPEFKFWRRLYMFHFMLIPLGKT